MLLNRYNFLRWFNAAPEPGLPDIPVAYWRDRNSCGYMPIAVPGESMSWYMNVMEGLDASVYTNFPELKLAIVRARDNFVLNNDVAPLQQHFIDPLDNDFYNIYATLVMPAANPDIYYFRIYRNTVSNEVFRSTYILVRTDTENINNTTTFARFRHDRYFYGIRYGDLPSFHQQFRLNMSLLERQYEGDKEVYKEVTTGKQRTLQNYLSRYCKLETYYFDPMAHEAAAVMVDHDSLELNGKAYVAKNAYKEPANTLSKVGKGEVELWDEEFSTVNRC